MKLIAGLGNPGKQYQATRHNIGFEVVRSLASRHGAGGSKNRFDGELQECLIRGERALLLMPHTFMNLSGRSVRQAVDYFKISIDDFLLVCDDFNLPLGTLRIRPQGRDGGQRGLADTIGHLGTDEFARLRVGIGPVPDRWDPADFVLGKFDRAENKLLESELIRVCEAVDTWVESGTSAAMNQYNNKR